MWGIGSTVMTVAALLAAPPSGPELPEPLPEPQQGCVLPLTTTLTPCPPGQPDRSPEGCIVPLRGSLPPGLWSPGAEPGPDRRTRPETVPLSP